MTIHRVTILGNPIPKERPRVVKGHTYTPKRTLLAEQAIRICARHLPRLAGPVKLSATFYRKDAHVCDLDNLLKTVLDALNGHAFADDRQVVWLSGVKTIDRENPRTVVEIEEHP